MINYIFLGLNLQLSHTKHNNQCRCQCKESDKYNRNIYSNCICYHSGKYGACGISQVAPEPEYTQACSPVSRVSVFGYRSQKSGINQRSTKTEQNRKKDVVSNNIGKWKCGQHNTLQYHSQKQQFLL